MTTKLGGFKVHLTEPRQRYLSAFLCFSCLFTRYTMATTAPSTMFSHDFIQSRKKRCWEFPFTHLFYKGQIFPRKFSSLKTSHQDSMVRTGSYASVLCAKDAVKSLCGIFQFSFFFFLLEILGSAVKEEVQEKGLEGKQATNNFYHPNGVAKTVASK